MFESLRNQIWSLKPNRRVGIVEFLNNNLYLKKKIIQLASILCFLFKTVYVDPQIVNFIRTKIRTTLFRNLILCMTTASHSINLVV